MKVDKVGSVVMVTLNVSLTEMQWATIQGKLESTGWQKELAEAIDESVFPPREG